MFHMYKYHQGAKLLDSFLTGSEKIGTKKYEVPSLQQSASIQRDGTVTVTLANLSIEESYPVEAVFMERKPQSVEASILTNEMHAMNTFETPDVVKEEVFEDVALSDRGVSFTIPPCSVVSLRIR